MNKNILIARFTVFAGIFGTMMLASLFSPRIADTANLTDVRDTLESSRLSFHSALEGGHSVGGSIIVIDTTNYGSKNTHNMHAGDEVYIGTSASNPYTISDIIDDNAFSIREGLASTDADDDDPVYIKRTASHVISFTSVSAIPNGTFRIRIPVSATLDNRDDGNPDDDGFDINSITTGDLDAPDNQTGYTFVSPTIGVGGTGACTAGYYCFNFPYTGTGASGTVFSGTGNLFTIGATNKLLNPSPNTDTEGLAEEYTVYIENLNAGNSAVDSTPVAIGVVESVRVTATVNPSITFTVAQMLSGTTACETTADVSSTAYSVPFGGLSINTFKNAAQSLTVSTNATSGYVVTIQEDDQLGKDGTASPYIADTLCDTTPCTHTTARDWTNATTYPGFGYSLHEDTDEAAAFEYNDSGTFYSKQLPAEADGGTDDPQTIMSGNTIASSEKIYVCYQIAVGATQQAGDYENMVTYTATGRF